MSNHSHQDTDQMPSCISAPLGVLPSTDVRRLKLLFIAAKIQAGKGQPGWKATNCVPLIGPGAACSTGQVWCNTWVPDLTAGGKL